MRGSIRQFMQSRATEAVSVVVLAGSFRVSAAFSVRCRPTIDSPVPRPFSPNNRGLRQEIFAQWPESYWCTENSSERMPTWINRCQRRGIAGEFRAARSWSIRSGRIPPEVSGGFWLLQPLMQRHAVGAERRLDPEAHIRLHALLHLRADVGLSDLAKRNDLGDLVGVGLDPLELLMGGAATDPLADQRVCDVECSARLQHIGAVRVSVGDHRSQREHAAHGEQLRPQAIQSDLRIESNFRHCGADSLQPEPGDEGGPFVGRYAGNDLPHETFDRQQQSFLAGQGQCSHLTEGREIGIAERLGVEPEQPRYRHHVADVASKFRA